jgi:hypothetical protein
MDDARRPTETEVMSLLEQMIVAVEEAQNVIQDDSRITGPKDRAEIQDQMRHVRALSLDVDRLVAERAPGWGRTGP